MKTQYFAFNLKISHSEFVDYTLCVVATDQDIKSVIHNIAANYYSRSEETELGFEINGGEIIVNYDDIQKITKQEYDVLKKYAYSEVVIDGPENLDNSETPIVGDAQGDCASDMLFVGSIGENAYITVKDSDERNSLTIKLNRNKDGVAINVFNFGEEDSDPIASTYAFYKSSNDDDESFSEKDHSHLIGSGPLSHTFDDNSELNIPGQEPFELYEVRAEIEGEERIVIVGVGEYNSDAWDAAGVEDENVYFWIDKERFDLIAKALNDGAELDGQNCINEIHWETKTVFNFNDNGAPYIKFEVGGQRYLECGLVDVIYQNNSMDICCRPDEIVWNESVHSWRCSE